MAANKLNIVILAAGKGTRMYSSTPKVLHRLADQPLLQHVINAAKQLQADKIIVVYGFGGDAVPNAFAHEQITWVEQKEQLGTGHAMLQTLPYLDEDANTLILLGDVPLVSVNRCQQLISKTFELGLLTVKKPNPTGYGRIVRDASDVIQAIVEHKDASEAQRLINEVNTGMMAVNNAHLKNWLGQLNNQNAQGEYYLTDVIAMAVRDGVPIRSAQARHEHEILGVNSRDQLAGLERQLQRQRANALLDLGVTVFDPERIDIRGELVCGQDVWIDVGCVFEGRVKLAAGVRVGPYCIIKNAEIAAGSEVGAFTHIDGAKIGPDARIGPYARIRPGSELAKEVHIGNFVEVKNSKIAAQSKANHLAYVGDSLVGARVNVGAGTITCNYDGVNKHQTIIEDDVFIGSDTQLVAPVRVGKGATLGAGTTLTKDAPPGKLTVSRAKQVSVEWQRPVKMKSKSTKAK